MSDIPMARKMIEDIADYADRLNHGDISSALRAVLPILTRRGRVRPTAARRSTVVDAHTAQQIRVYAKTRPWLSLQEVADVFKTNPGRVSEALHGDR